MLVCGHDPDIPVFLSDGVYQLAALFLGEIARKLKFPGNDLFCQERNELATELRPDYAGREKETVSCIDPLPVRRESAAGNEAMDMRMNPERLAPTVERRDDSRQRAEMLRICQEFLKTLPGCLEQQVGESRPVVFPQVIEFAGNGEYYMKIVALNEALELLVNPSGDLDEGAERARTMPA